MAESSPAHVERRCARGYLGEVVEEDEFRAGVDEAADQPCAGGPVDVDIGAGRPFHARTSAWRDAVARSSTAAREAARCGRGKKSRPAMRRSSEERRVGKECRSR